MFLRAVLAAALVAGCQGQTWPEPPPTFGTPESVSAGSAIFQEHCAICHGETGNGQGQRHASLSSDPPDFHLPHWQERRPPGRVFEIVKNGKRGTSMPAWIGTLDDDQIWQVVSWVKSRGEQG